MRKSKGEAGHLSQPWWDIQLSSSEAVDVALVAVVADGMEVGIFGVDLVLVPVVVPEVVVLVLAEVALAVEAAPVAFYGTLVY